MLVGILSDSHGRHEMVRRAMALFNGAGVEHVIHCGDVGGVDVFDEMAGLPLTFVWGNTDSPDAGVGPYLESVGIVPPNGAPRRVTLGGRTFAVFHGHEPSFGSTLDSSAVDYVLHGHTHAARDERIGRTRIINPGALHRVRIPTVATLNTASDDLTFHEVDTGDA